MHRRFSPSFLQEVSVIADEVEIAFSQGSSIHSKDTCINFLNLSEETPFISPPFIKGIEVPLPPGFKSSSDNHLRTTSIQH
jgi:hypothetical protein